MKKVLFSLVMVVGILAPIATQAETDPIEPLVVSHPFVSAQTNFVVIPSHFKPLTIFPPNE